MKFSNYKKGLDKKNKEEPAHKDIDTNKIEELMNSFSSYSQEELLEEFFKLSEEKKKQGNLDNNELNKIKNTLMPHLSQEQQQNLDKIINLVK